MPTVFYWKKSIFLSEIDEARNTKSYEFFSKYDTLHQANKGDHMWVFAKEGGNYVLIAKVVVQAVSRKKHSRHGPYSIVGDPKLSMYYETKSQGNRFRHILSSSVTLRSGKRWNQEIALHFQGHNSVQVLDQPADAQLNLFAKNLTTLD